MNVTVWFRKFVCYNFTRKFPENSDSMFSSFFMLENIWCHYFPWKGRNSWEIKIFFELRVSEDPNLIEACSKFFVNLARFQVEWWYHMFLALKWKNIWNLSDILWVKWVAKNTVPGSSGTHFMHMMVNAALAITSAVEIGAESLQQRWWPRRIQNLVNNLRWNVLRK